MINSVSEAFERRLEDGGTWLLSLVVIDVFRIECCELDFFSDVLIIPSKECALYNDSVTSTAWGRGYIGG